jgi:hypothetical protein
VLLEGTSFGYVVINKPLCDLYLRFLFDNDYFHYSLAKNFRHPHYVTISMGDHVSLALIHNCFEGWLLEIFKFTSFIPEYVSTH